MVKRFVSTVLLGIPFICYFYKNEYSEKRIPLQSRLAQILGIQELAEYNFHFSIFRKLFSQFKNQKIIREII